MRTLDIVAIVIAKIVSKVLSHLIIRYLERREKEKGSKRRNQEP